MPSREAAPDPTETSSSLHPAGAATSRGSPERTRDSAASQRLKGPGPSPRSLGASGQSQPSGPPRTPSTRRALPGSGATSAGLRGLEAEPKPGRSPEPPWGRERAVPEPSAPPGEEGGPLPPRPRAQLVPAQGPGASN